jgi:hypothetical protein
MTMVVPTISNQERIDALVASLHGQSVVYEKLCQLMFVVIDRFCEGLPSQRGQGRRKTYPDSDILKIDMLMHLTGKRGETEILREIERHYQQYFVQVPGQSRLWHRIRQALPLIEGFRRYLRDQLGVALEEIRILDSCPIPVALPNSRPGRGNGFDLADGGYCASKKLKFLGFKLGMLITPQGIPDIYDLFSARPHDVKFLDDLLGEAYDIIGLGDKGFIDDPKRDALAEDQNVLLITYRRRNQKQQNNSVELWALNTYRQLIETVYSQLDGHMYIQNTGAKTDIGLIKPVMGIVTAFTLGIYLNFLLGRHLLAIKELFA